MTNFIIGVDIGTGSTKALAVDTHGNVLGKSQVFYEIDSSAPGQCEQDPELVFKAFLKSVKEIVFSHGLPKAISLSSAMHSVIPVNALGKAIYPMILWSDNRSKSFAKDILNLPIANELCTSTGTPIHAMSPLAKILWFRKTYPSTFEQTKKFLSIKEFIWFKLFGEFEVDHSIGSATGLMEIHFQKWSTQALAIAGIDESYLSTLVPTSHIRSGVDKKYASQMGIDSTMDFVIGASDGCLANLGSFVTAPGIAALTIGTSGAIRVAGTEAIVNTDSMIFNYKLNEHLFVSGGPTNNGGNIIRWYAEKILHKKLTSHTQYGELLSGLKTTSPGAEGLIFLPYLFGERAPIWDSEATGAFFGIRNIHEQKHFTRAVIEGVSMALFDIGKRMEENGAVFESLHVSGGFIHSQEWLQILADIFQKKVRLMSSEDASAIGAAFMGLKACGIIQHYNEIEIPSGAETVPDKTNREVYEPQYKKFKGLYANLKQLMHDLI